VLGVSGYGIGLASANLTVGNTAISNITVANANAVFFIAAPTLLSYLTLKAFL
jgi:hypothetical protein